MTRVAVALRVWSHQENYQVPWFLFLLPLDMGAQCLVWKRSIAEDRGLDLGALCLVGILPYNAAAIIVAAFLTKQHDSWAELACAMAQFALWRVWRADSSVTLHTLRPVVGVGLALALSVLWLIVWATLAVAGLLQVRS